MANTIRASKNTFSGGLVMDLSPDNTPNEVLTSALNATLVTFNGNEMSLQNDMGNGRVETARLPDGYIPVGTCEFGDIIYIVSYNPLTNKSQIGCFPSPERNISTEEIGSTGQTLSVNDFQILNNGTPTGKLKTNSVKKILYDNKLNPGDKFIIYDKNKALYKSPYITDLGNTSHEYGTFPKLLRIHVVAIEDGGKIVYLDSTLRWYNKYSSGYKDYFMNEVVNTVDLKPDIDSYRNMLSSGYSVFQSKVSGKLALLIELEKIKGFSCTYNTYASIREHSTQNKTFKNCKVYWNISWETEDVNINPSYIVLTESEMTGTTPTLAGKVGYYSGSDGTYQLEFQNYNMTLPEKYPNSDYWWKNISLGYDMSSNGTYATFIGSNTDGESGQKSYQVHLNNFINTVISSPTIEDEEYPENNKYAYQGQSLQKLNVERVSDTDNNSASVYRSYPRIENDKGYYYINATQAEYDGTNLRFYTQSSENGERMVIPSYSIPDDIVNNYFHNGVYKEFAEFVIPIKQQIDNIEFTPDISNLIYHYQITPAMPYGLLNEYAIDGYIDFSKLGSGKIDLTGWRYFNTENTSTLTMNLDAYIEDNMGIAEVVLEFYDNQGFAAGYHITNRESFAGQFTEYIPLNAIAQNYKLSNYDSNNAQKIHAGQVLTSLEGVTQAIRLDNGKPVKLYIYNNKAYTDANHTNEYNLTIYSNDCGSLYSNVLYLVKIIVKYCPYNALGELDSMDSSKFKYFYRWYWTNTMYNQYYYNTTDFDVLKFNLTLDLQAKYSSNEYYKYNKFTYSPYYQDIINNGDELYKALSANVQVISSAKQNEEYKNNLQVSLSPGLQQDFNTFSLRRSDTNTPGYAEEYVSVDVITNGGQYVENTPDKVEIKHAGEGVMISNIIQPISNEDTNLITNDNNVNLSYVGNTLRNTLTNYMNLPEASNPSELWNNDNSYQKYKNYFNIKFDNQTQEGIYGDTTEQYISYKNNIVQFENKTYVTKQLKEIYNNNHLDMCVNIVHYSKYLPLKSIGSSGYNAMVPLIQNESDLTQYGLTLCTHNPNDPESRHIGISNMLIMRWWNDCDGTEGHFYVWRLPLYHDSSGYWYDQNHNGEWITDYGYPKPFSIYANNTKHQFYEYNNTQWYNLMESTPGFILTGFSPPQKNYDEGGVYINQNNIAEGSATNFSWSYYSQYITNSEDYTPPIGNRLCREWKDNLLYWTGEPGLENPYAAFVNLSYQGDKKNAFHFLNNWAIVSRNTCIHRFAPHARWGYTNGQPNYPPYPWHIGDALASVLANIYVYAQGGTQQVTYDSDIMYLSDNYTTFTKDIVYKMYVNTADIDQKSLINISGMHYNEYILAVYNNFEENNNYTIEQLSDALNDYKNTISIDNIDVKLQTIIKNCPLQLKVNYIVPEFGLLGNKGTTKTIAYPIYSNPVEIDSQISPDTLYYIKTQNGKKYAQVLDSGFTPQFCNQFSIDNGKLRANATWINNITLPDVYSTFSYTDGTLKINKSTAPASGQCLSLTTKEEGWYTIYDIYKNDSIFPYMKLW